MKIRFYFPVESEKRRHINNEVPEDRKVGEGFDESRFVQEVFDMGPAGQDDLTIDLHGTGPADRSPAGIAE